MRALAKAPGRLFLKWLKFLILGAPDGTSIDAAKGAPRSFRLFLVVCAGMIVFLGWYFVDRNESYRVGYPSPRSYLAQSSARFVDNTATTDLRNQAAEQIVKVRVRDDKATQLVKRRLAELKKSGNVDFLSAPLSRILNDLPEAERKKILSVVIDIAEKNFDKSINRTEQSALIWESLRRVNLGQAEKNVVYQILDVLLLPTVVEDAEMTLRLREDVSQKIPAVVREIRLGGQLVEKGQIVTPGLADILRSQGYPDATFPWKNLAFVLLVTFAWSIWLTWLGTKQSVVLSEKEWMYIAVVLIIEWSAQRWLALWDLDSLVLLLMAGWISLTLPPVFAFHITLGGGLIGYLLGFPEMTSLIALGFIVCGVAAGASYLFAKEASSRIMIWRNVFSLGIGLSLTSMFVRWGFGLAFSWELLMVYLLFCALWSSLVVAVLPLWESLFEIISPLRLLEMSNQSQPLLKRLQLEAPGTYHHTISVSSLAEAVADRLGMNGLLVKTGAYYHDIGKLKRPLYFVENQSFGDNIHDRLAPQESARIILQHVPDGLVLADEYKLPPAIKNFISEHHGKTFLSYFYQKALAADPEAASKLDKADFTYPGPIPQSRETALLMLTDSVEAALKSRKEPLVGRQELDKLVGDVIDSKILSGQFADVEFTLKDLSAIKNAFVDVLISMHHTREMKPIAPSEEESSPPEATPLEADHAPRV